LLNEKEEEEMAKKRKSPTLSAKERARRARVTGFVKYAGKKGFYGTMQSLKGKEGVTNPVKLAGYLKGQAKKRGELSPEHPYTGRKKKAGAKYARLRAMAKRMTK